MSEYLTVPEFARRIGVKDATVYIAIKQKRVRSIRMLGRIGIHRDELDKFKRRKNGTKTKVLKRAA